jgi:hypothetical protein
MSHRSLHPARAPGSNGTSCQATRELNGGTEENFDGTDATSNGECKMEVDIPSGAKIGTATIHMKVTDDQNVAQDPHDIEVKK